MTPRNYSPYLLLLLVRSISAPNQNDFYNRFFPSTLTAAASCGNPPGNVPPLLFTPSSSPWFESWDLKTGFAGGLFICLFIYFLFKLSGPLRLATSSGTLELIW